ncbi:MAG: DISARM system SNF2-like helicase DrmD [Chloroflexi bacterium]|nr:DISARM system SNF2-like helicase DrmD [Chloroflexota bacterium]MCI0730560.1 DISARM system SNF2-like helicase DrmD [Chloroflexota bacterium]
MTISTTAIPEQGQIVTVRQRRYVVTEVLASALPPSPLGSPAAPQHLISLNSIEDDALGEGLQVIWELEPGARTSERVDLPDAVGFDSPQRLDAFLDAVRWGAIASADVRSLQAPFRSGIDLEDYQLDPLVRAVQMPRANLLIADDVGLGKTIEAGLVIQELIVRNRVRTVLVVCPAGLQLHWRDQMRDKFGLEFRIVDSQLMKQLRRSRGIHVNPWSHFPRLITSIDFLKRERPMRLFREVLPAEGEATYPRRFDLVVVDEAHNVAPAGRGRFAEDSLRTQAMRTLAPHFEHKLFLTATPHNGYQESFSALLELLDDQRFARGVLPNRRQLEAVMVRRLKSELVRWDGQPRFPQRRLDVIEVAYSDEEKQVHAWLKEYTRLRQENARGENERFAAEFVLKLLKKRLFSSPAAFALTLAQHQRTLAGTQPEKKQARRPSIGILQRQIAQMEEDYADDADYEEATTGAVETSSRLLAELSPRERGLLNSMSAWADKASAQRDCKTNALIAWLRQIVKPAGVWNDERVIIFTEYRATQNWLHEKLVAAGLASGERLLTLYGGMEPDQRERIKAAFQARPEQSPVRILLATDAASEGIDLQNHCHRLVHFEIPWNPNRMEQRNGRIDRHGQKHDPLIYHFVGQGYRPRLHDPHALAAGDLEADLEFLMQAARKVEQIREDLGKVGPVIAAQVEEAMLGRRARLDTVLAEQDAGAVRRQLKFERDLARLIEQHTEQLRETRQSLRLSPQNIQAVVEIALELAGQPPLRPAEVEGIWPDPSRAACPVFHLPPLSGSWAACAEGLAHPHTGEIRPVVFDHQLAQGRDDVVLAHLNHRLVQMALRLLRAEVWSPEGRQGLYRVTARRVPNHALDTPAVIAHARLVVTGGDSHRLHEEIITAGGLIEQGRFQRLNVGQTEAALQAALGAAVSAPTQQQLLAIWLAIRPGLERALEARAESLTGRMERLLQERAQKEMADIAAVLTELAQAIERELAEPAYRQLELFSDNERTQLARNTQALRARLEQIPAEIVAEQAAIRARFANPQPWLFPVAVTFLVPMKLA